MKPYYQCVPVEVKGMKKTCDRCRALIESQGEALKCQLGSDTKNLSLCKGMHTV